MDLVAICESPSGMSGAMFVTVVFLSVFVVLLAFDAYVSFRALRGGLVGDGRTTEKAVALQTFFK